MMLSATELEALQWQIVEIWQRNRNKTRAPHAGPFASFFRGQGMELHDSRPYQPGDDIRHLDWRATARSGKAISKVFLDERGLNLFLVIDRHPGMFFGTRGELKAASAARCAAILAFSALAARERVAGVVLGEETQYFPPASTTGGVLPLLQAAAAPVPAAPATRPSTLPSLLTALARKIEPGTDLCLISDFHNLTDSNAPLLRILARDCATHALRIRDTAEEHLEDAGPLRLRSPFSGETLTVDSGSSRLRERYRAAVMKRNQALHKLLQGCGIALTTIDNHRDTLSQLEEYGNNPSPSGTPAPLEGRGVGVREPEASHAEH